MTKSCKAWRDGLVCEYNFDRKVVKSANEPQWCPASKG